MEINKEILKSWSILYERGDKQELARLTKKSYPTILKAFNGHADYDLVESINKFYKQRKERNDERKLGFNDYIESIKH